MPDTEEWNELNLSERPAYKLLRDALGYVFLEGKDMDMERENPRHVVLQSRLSAAIKKLNPWMNDEDTNRVVRRLVNVSANDVLDANMKVYNELVYGATIEKDLGGGKKNQTVRIIDFESPDNNDFLVVRQVRVWGPKEEIIPDLVVFLNGIPVAVLECKSPTTDGPIEKGKSQIIRYQDKALGAPHLFYYNQIVASICGQAAECATVGSPKRYFSSWKDPWPYTVDDIEAKLGRAPTPQDIMLFGMFSKSSILDLIQNFVVYEPENGRTVKKMARYQQYRSVNKALKKIKEAKSIGERNGIVWHWQGSGKSLTMLWLAVKLRRSMSNPPIVVVTDRRQLDNQIFSTFERCGFPNPSRADSVRELRELLKIGRGQTVLTTIQKFQNVSGEEKGEYPVIDASKDIFVLVDEAHRTQYKDFAANMRQALPNACFIGFTGTPIDKKERSTVRTFGDYIDKYTIEQSVADNATVPIYYESRLPKMRVEDEGRLDEMFNRMFDELGDDGKRELRKRYGTPFAIIRSKERIRSICLDILDHYEKFIRPNGFKAQIVAIDRETAVLYKTILDELHGPRSAAIISGSQNDPDWMKPHTRPQGEIDTLVDQFKQPMEVSDLSIIIVAEMLLTGFDAPIEQVMYFDSNLKEHNLLQAIARVNRPYEGKTYGLIVDYYGVSNHLDKALSIFNAGDVVGALRPKSDEVAKLQEAHRAAMSVFDGISLDDLDSCILVLEPETTRIKFEAAFRSFAKSMDMVMPDSAANPYRADLKTLGRIRNAARVRFRDDALNLSDYGAKVRKLIEDYIRSTGVDQLLAPISIMDEGFKEQVDSLSSDKAKASEMEHALKHEIKVKVEENPVYYNSLKERLEGLITEHKEKRIQMALYLKSLSALIDDVKGIQARASDFGLSEFEYSIFDTLQGATEKDSRKQLAKDIAKNLEDALVLDWRLKDDVQRMARQGIKKNLMASGYPEDKLEEITKQIMDLTRVHVKR